MTITKTPLIIGLATLSLFGCKKEVAPAPTPPAVTVANPTVTNVTRYIYYSGNTEANTTVQLTARVKGYLKQMNFAAGKTGKKKEPPFIIQPGQNKNEQKKAKAKTKKAKTKPKKDNPTPPPTEGGT